jgi:hypothetical protein
MHDLEHMVSRGPSIPYNSISRNIDSKFDFGNMRICRSPFFQASIIGRDMGLKDSQLSKVLCSMNDYM